MKTATYTNKATNETYQISGENVNLETAWGHLARAAASRMGWNFECFAMDVKVTVN